MRTFGKETTDLAQLARRLGTIVKETTIISIITSPRCGEISARLILFLWLGLGLVNARSRRSCLWLRAELGIIATPGGRHASLTQGWARIEGRTLWKGKLEPVETTMDSGATVGSRVITEFAALFAVNVVSIATTGKSLIFILSQAVSFTSWHSRHMSNAAGRHDASYAPLATEDSSAEQFRLTRLEHRRSHGKWI